VAKGEEVNFPMERKKILPPLVLFLISLVFRLPFFGVPFWRTPDAVEFIDVARNIVLGKGLIQTIKWNFFESTPVITSAFHGKPFFASVIFSVILHFQNDPYLLQLFLLVLGAVNVVIFYFIAHKFLSGKISVVVSLLFALNPNILITNRMVLSDEVFYFFVLLSLLLFFGKDNFKKYILLGIITALSYLTRAEGSFLFIAFFLTSIFQKKKALQIILLTGFFLLTALPYFWGNAIINGSPFFNYNSYHFKVFHFSDSMFTGYGRIYPSALGFMKTNLGWIINKIWQATVSNIQSLIGLTFFGPLMLLAIFYKNFSRKFLPILFFCFATFLTFTIPWAIFAEPERHLAMVFILGLIPLFALVKGKYTRDPFFILIVLLMLVVYLGFDVHRIVWSRTVEAQTDAWSYQSRKTTYNYLKNHTNKNSIVASTNPWMITLFATRPSIMLGTNINNRNYCGFISQYKISYLLTGDTNLEKTLNREAVFVLKDQYLSLYKTSICK
jgi:4-amino-4-deoxy-L-arabinose transferase-like glycosyltransferase